MDHVRDAWFASYLASIALMTYTKSATRWRRITRSIANQQPVSQAPDYSYQARAFGKSKTGDYLPNWRRVIRSGGNATTPFSGVLNDLTVQYANYRVDFDSRFTVNSPWEPRYSLESSWSQWANTNPISHFLILDGAFFERARAKAIKSLYRTIWNSNHQFQGGVFMGEIGKTVKMIASAANALSRGVFDYAAKAVGIRNGKGKKKSKEKALADTYLEATFGWSPLIHDCQDFAKALARLNHEKRGKRLRFRAHGAEEGQASKSTGTVTFGFLYADLLVYETAKVDVIYRGFLQGPKFEAANPSLDRIISLSGFDLRSFVPTVWELIPYSFLVDYFTNIGDCLQAYSTDTSPVVGLWKTEIWESKRTQTFNPIPATTIANLTSVYGSAFIRNIRLSGGVGKYVTITRNFSRSAASVPLMLPRFEGFDLRRRQFTNIGALLTSKLR